MSERSAAPVVDGAEDNAEVGAPGADLDATRRRPRGVARAPRARQPLRADGATLVAASLLIVFTLVASFAAYLLVGSKLAAARQQDVLYGELTRDLALATVPVGGPIATGTPLGLVRVPALGLDQVFVLGSGSDQTLSAPGLTHSSVLPGQAGVSVLVGRRATGGAPFAHLDLLQPGDRIEVTTGQGEFDYVVDVVRRSDDPDQQIVAAASRLTLITSDPALAPTRTLQVSAVLDGDALPASTGSAAVAEDQPGATSHRGGVALLLWAQLLLLAVVVVSVAAVRRPARALWIGAVPVLLALLWQVDAHLAALLPNTL